MLPWLSWLKRPTVNRKIEGSIPSRSVVVGSDVKMTPKHGTYSYYFQNQTPKMFSLARAVGSRPTRAALAVSSVLAGKEDLTNVPSK